ncbi:ATP-binding cassette domain-containing protein [Candidatus Poribacteria bacterium]|nr:ATP-binding cassette domain-containing protein [Candidatus Poribacteria bacterium]
MPESSQKLTSFLRPYWKQIIIGPFLMLVEVVMDLAQPRMMQRIIDVGIAQMDMSIVINTGLIMIGLALIGAFGGAGNTAFAVWVSQRYGADLRTALFRKIQSLSFGNLDKLETGQLITRLTNDVTQIQLVVLIALRILVRAPLILVGSLIMAVITSPSLALILLALGPVSLLVIILVIRKAHPMFLRVQERLDRINTVMQENLSGIRVVKAFVRGDYENQRFGNANENLRNDTVKAMRLVAVVMPFMMLAVNIGVACVIWFGGLQVAAGNMKVGQIMAFVNYLLHALFSLMMVSMLLIQISRAKASADRIQEVLNSKPEINDKTNALTMFQPRGKVAFESVTFGYDDNYQEPVLRDVSFEVQPGQTVAILGATGSGKSSLVNLIPRFYDVMGGKVKIDNIDVRDIKNDALRKSVVFVLQESVLFSGTIRDNIRYGRPEATDPEVVEAAKAAQAHDFISGFPEGYDTQLGQRGVNLSGGQKQRVAIARALVTKPRILILDDSTSSVDVETEARIQDSLAELMKDCTSFIIAQRISTVLNADKILILEDGKIAAQGTHSQLLKSSPIYREIYNSQLGNGGIDIA